MGREAKKKSSILGTSSLQNYHQMPLPYQQFMPENKSFLSCNHKHKLLDFANRYWDSDWNRVLCSDDHIPDLHWMVEGL